MSNENLFYISFVYFQLFSAQLFDHIKSVHYSGLLLANTSKTSDEYNTTSNSNSDTVIQCRSCSHKSKNFNDLCQHCWLCHELGHFKCSFGGTCGFESRHNRLMIVKHLIEVHISNDHDFLLKKVDEFDKNFKHKDNPTVIQEKIVATNVPKICLLKTNNNNGNNKKSNETEQQKVDSLILNENSKTLSSTEQYLHRSSSLPEDNIMEFKDFNNEEDDEDNDRFLIHGHDNQNFQQKNDQQITSPILLLADQDRSKQNQFDDQDEEADGETREFISNLINEDNDNSCVQLQQNGSFLNEGNIEPEGKLVTN